jgi:hypothetical protein
VRNRVKGYKCILPIPAKGNVIDTPLAKLWFEEDILFSVSKDGNRNMADLKKTLQIIKDMVGNKKVLLIADTSNTQYYNIEMRNELISSFTKLLKAVALVPCTPMGKIMATILFKRQDILPAKLFDDLEEAKAWIAQYK